MQKKLIALAVAGLMSAPVMAQSNVTVYGIVDMGFVYETAGNARAARFDNGITAGSRLGFRGTEDLGNGLKGLFTLEYGIGPDTGTIGGVGSARQSWVGLEGGFGTVSLGRHQGPGWAIHRYDTAGAASWSATQMLSAVAGTIPNIQSSGRSRLSNSISYKTPAMGGFGVHGVYRLGEQQEVTKRRTGDLAQLGLDYAGGPMAIGLVLSQENRGAASNRNEWYLGGNYDLGMAKVFASYQRSKVGSDTDKIWHVGANAKVSDAGSVEALYGSLDDARGSSFDAQTISLAYRHNMSKRTMAYAGYAHSRNKSNQVAGLAFTGVQTGAPGKNRNGLAVGLRHVF